MQQINLNDTIAAIATPLGSSGIGIVRISGKGALCVADKIFLSKDGRKPAQFKTYTTHYGWVVDSRAPRAARRASKVISTIRNTQYAEQKIVDEVILTVMLAPRSYTKEDVVEINCHGGIVAMRATLDLILENGCRLAEPGEFTKRAFLNGRIDLVQAEAVLDVINAKTDSGLRTGIGQLKGILSKEINKVREKLLENLTVLEANIDFPEEEIGAVDSGKIRENLADINRHLMGILEGARVGRIFREGINVVICGRPNVGKSSLLNALLKRERSIVTPIAGTTRDTIEEVIDIKGIPVRIVDTAGILEPRDLIEKKAVLRSKKYIESADLVLLIFDGNRNLTREDELLIRKLKKKNIIAIINKVDLKQKIARARLTREFDSLIDISAKKSRNIVLLEEKIADLVYQGRVASIPESSLVSNTRHIEILKNAQKLIAEAANSLDNKLSLEFIAEGIKDSLSHLDILVGKKFYEDLLDKIFGEFCIGK